MQSLTRLEIERVDHAGDGGRSARAQRLLHGPQRLRRVCRLDQDHTGRIETESMETMTVRNSIAGKTADRQDEQERPAVRHAAQQRRDEAKGSRQVAVGFGRNFMQGSQRESARWQMRIEGR